MYNDDLLKWTKEIDLILNKEERKEFFKKLEFVCNFTFMINDLLIGLVGIILNLQLF